MNNAARATKSIQRRLVLFVLRAIAVVFVLAILINLAVVALQLRRETRLNPAFISPPVGVLETYYLVNGSWDGVERVILANGNPPGPGLRNPWENTVLVDNAGRVVLDHGLDNAREVGTVYVPSQNAVETNVVVNDRIVGKVFVERTFIPREWSLAVRVIGSAVLFSFLPGIAILVIGLLLTNRVLTPLSQVIGATQAVAGGDLSARVPYRQRNDDLRSLTEGFNHMADTLERNDRERREMLADIAHELRTPLTVLRGRLEGIIDGVYSPSQEVIAPALAETYLLERLVDDLRLLALAEAHQLHFEISQVELEPLIQRVIDLFVAQASENQVVLKADFASKGPHVLADPQRLEQVVGNLLDNALRFAPNGSQIAISVFQAGQSIQIDVMDEGPGVPDADLALIFNRFWREEKARTRSGGGSGLGLAIAKQLIEAQGGTIRAFNRPEGGLRIQSELPAQ